MILYCVDELRARPRGRPDRHIFDNAQRTCFKDALLRIIGHTFTHPTDMLALVLPSCEVSSYLSSAQFVDKNSDAIVTPATSCTRTGTASTAHQSSSDIAYRNQNLKYSHIIVGHLVEATKPCRQPSMLSKLPKTTPVLDRCGEGRLTGCSGDTDEGTAARPRMG